MTLRLLKILFVAAVGLNLMITTLDNAVFDYGSNYQFVRHVLSMDTLFSGEHNVWRAVRAPAGRADRYWIYQGFYAGIIVWEAVTAALCFAGAGRLWRARRAPAARFNQAKPLALIGLAVSLLQWFLAFETVGGGWFQMWQSTAWNGLGAASRMFVYVAVIFFLVQTDDKDLESA